MALDLTARQSQKQAQALAPLQLQGLRLLAKSLPELRTEIMAEMARNPAIEDVGTPLESPLSEVEKQSDENSPIPDYPEDDFTPGLNHDEDAAERRQVMFDNLVREETLQEHLLAQFPLSDIPQADWQMAEVLVGDFDEKGYYKGSLPDAAMAFGCSEADVLTVLAKIRELDPPGCGARDARECLLAQVDVIPDAELRQLVAKLIDRHLDDLAAGRLEEVAKALDVQLERVTAALQALRTLDGRPGRQYPSERERVEYVNPEIHAVRREGRWMAETDERSLPEIRFSQKFADLLKDPAQSAETKAYVRERIAAAQAFREAVVRRQETVRAIAQQIFDRQQEFFEQGFQALKPLTEQDVAKAVGVHVTTVSRTVRDKYAETPKGTVELRRFFVSGFKTQEGQMVSQDEVLTALKSIVEAEDPAHPLSDEKIAEQLKSAGYPVARRTVAKYRDKLSIPGASARCSREYDKRCQPTRRFAP